MTEISLTWLINLNKNQAMFAFVVFCFNLQQHLFGYAILQNNLLITVRTGDLSPVI